LRSAVTRRHFVDDTAFGKMVFQGAVASPYLQKEGSIAEMDQGLNISYHARKEQCLAFGSPRIEKHVIDRVLPDGEAQYLHPKDEVFPEKGRLKANHNARSFGANVEPGSLKFEAKAPKDVATDAAVAMFAATADKPEGGWTAPSTADATRNEMAVVQLPPDKLMAMVIEAKDKVIAVLEEEVIAGLKDRLAEKDLAFNMLQQSASKVEAQLAHQLGKMEATFVSRVILECGVVSQYPGLGTNTTQKIERLWDEMRICDKFGRNCRFKDVYLKYLDPLHRALLFQYDKLSAVSMRSLMDDLSRSHHTPSSSVAGFYIGGPGLEPEYAAALSLCCIALAIDNHHNFSPLKVLNAAGDWVCSINWDDIELAPSVPSRDNEDSSRQKKRLRFLPQFLSSE